VRINHLSQILTNRNVTNRTNAKKLVYEKVHIQYEYIQMYIQYTSVNNTEMKGYLKYTLRFSSHKLRSSYFAQSQYFYLSTQISYLII